MATKRLLLLFCLTAALWSGIWLWPKLEPKLKPEIKPTVAPWIELSLVTLKRLDINPSGSGLAFSLVNEDGHWYVLESAPPTSHKVQTASTLPSLPRMHADRARVESLIALINQVRPKRSLGSLPKDKAMEFGLDNPTAKLTIDTGQSVPWSLQLGATNPTGEGVFGQTSSSGDACLLLDTRYREELAHKADAFYDKRIFNLSPEAVTKVRLEGPADERFELTRNATALAFTWPEALQSKSLAAAEVDRFLHDLTGAQVLTFMVTPLLVPPKPYQTLSIWTAGATEPQTVTLYVRSAEQDIFIGKADRHEPFFSLSKDTAARLAPSAFSLRERSVLNLDVAQVRRLCLFRPASGNIPAAKLMLEQTEQGWKSQDKKVLPAMDTYLWRLNDLKYTAEPVPFLSETAIPALTWELSGGPATPSNLKTALEFFHDQQLPTKTCWVRVTGRDDITPVPDALLEDLLRQFGDIQNLSPTPAGNSH